MLGIANQVAGPLEKPHHPGGNGVGDGVEFLAGRWLHRPEVTHRIVHPVQVKHVEVRVQIQRRSKSLDESHRATLRPRFHRHAGAVDQERADDPVHDGQHSAHHTGVGREQEAQRIRHAQHPLADWPFRQYRIDQVRGAVRHAASTTTGAESPSFATERNQFLVVAGFALDPQKTMFKSTAFQVVLELLHDIRGQRFALCRQLRFEVRPMLLDELIEQCSLGTMAEVASC